MGRIVLRKCKRNVCKRGFVAVFGKRRSDVFKCPETRVFLLWLGVPYFRPGDGFDFAVQIGHWITSVAEFVGDRLLHGGGEFSWIGPGVCDVGDEIVAHFPFSVAICFGFASFSGWFKKNPSLDSSLAHSSPFAPLVHFYDYVSGVSFLRLYSAKVGFRSVGTVLMERWFLRPPANTLWRLS